MKKYFLSFRACAVAVMIATLSIATFPAASRGQSRSNSCQVKAYVADPDPNGLNVRRSPNSRGSILGKLPLHAEVTILAGRGNWVLVAPIAPSTGAFQGRGWVFAPLLGVYTRGYGRESIPLHERPTRDSKIVGQVPPDTEVRLSGCSGKWVMIKSAETANVETAKEPRSGWLEPGQQCPSPFTSCP